MMQQRGGILVLFRHMYKYSGVALKQGQEVGQILRLSLRVRYPKKEALHADTGPMGKRVCHFKRGKNLEERQHWRNKNHGIRRNLSISH